MADESEPGFWKSLGKKLWETLQKKGHPLVDIVKYFKSRTPEEKEREELSKKAMSLLENYEEKSELFKEQEKRRRSKKGESYDPTPEQLKADFARYVYGKWEARAKAAGDPGLSTTSATSTPTSSTTPTFPKIPSLAADAPPGLLPDSGEALEELTEDNLERDPARIAEVEARLSSVVPTTTPISKVAEERLPGEAVPSKTGSGPLTADLHELVDVATDISRKMDRDESTAEAEPTPEINLSDLAASHIISSFVPIPLVETTELPELTEKDLVEVQELADKYASEFSDLFGKEAYEKAEKEGAFKLDKFATPELSLPSDAIEIIPVPRVEDEIHKSELIAPPAPPTTPEITVVAEGGKTEPPITVTPAKDKWWDLAADAGSKLLAGEFPTSKDVKGLLEEIALLEKAIPKPGEVIPELPLPTADLEGVVGGVGKPISTALPTPETRVGTPLVVTGAAPFATPPPVTTAPTAPPTPPPVKGKGKGKVTPPTEAPTALPFPAITVDVSVPSLPMPTSPVVEVGAMGMVVDTTATKHEVHTATTETTAKPVAPVVLTPEATKILPTPGAPLPTEHGPIPFMEDHTDYSKLAPLAPSGLPPGYPVEPPIKRPVTGGEPPPGRPIEPTPAWALLPVPEKSEVGSFGALWRAFTNKLSGDEAQARADADVARAKKRFVETNVEVYKAPRRVEKAESRLRLFEEELRLAVEEGAKPSVVEETQKRVEKERAKVFREKAKEETAHENFKQARESLDKAYLRQKTARADSQADLIGAAARVTGSETLAKVYSQAKLAIRASAGDPDAAIELAAQKVEDVKAAFSEFGQAAMPGTAAQTGEHAFAGLSKLADVTGDPILTGIAKFGEVLFGTIDKIEKWSDALHQHNMRFAEYSAGMAQVKAITEVRQIYLEKEMGDRTAHTAQALADARAERQAAATPTEAFFQNWKNVMAAGLEKLGTGLFQIVNDVTGAKAPDLDKLDTGEAARFIYEIGNLPHNLPDYTRPPRFKE